MANKHITMHKIRKIYNLHSQGYSKLKISERLQLSRNTVKKYLRFIKDQELNYQTLKKFSDKELSNWILGTKQEKSTVVKQLESYFPSYEKRLTKSKATRLLLWEEYKSKHPEGLGYSRFCYYYRFWKKTSNPIMRFHHKAGDKMFVDFAGQKLCIVNKQTGEVKEVEVFVSILGASGLTYVEACESQQKEDFIGACENAIHYYQGVPACITTDNLKAAVKKSNKYEPSLNETFEDFAEHYDTAVLPCRSYKPRDKALVEGIMRVVYTRIYYPIENQTFYTLASLNQRILELLEQHNNTPMQKRPYSRREFFEQEEKDCLQPLPVQRYELKRNTYATVSKDCHVYLQKDKHYYSVPHHLIRKKVKISYSQSIVEIYRNYQRVALHQRNRIPYGTTTVMEHLPANLQFVQKWSTEMFLEQAQDIGPNCKEFILKVMDTQKHPEQGYKICVGVFSFGKKVTPERLEKACKRALHYEVYSYHAIKNILKNNLENLPQEEQNTSSKVIPLHKNIRGKEYYQ